MRVCHHCGAWVTGAPYDPIKNIWADQICGACDLRETQGLFQDNYENWPTDQMVEWWRTLIDDAVLA